jgi:hypothetical protein
VEVVNSGKKCHAPSICSQRFEGRRKLSISGNK